MSNLPESQAEMLPSTGDVEFLTDMLQDPTSRESTKDHAAERLLAITRSEDADGPVKSLAAAALLLNKEPFERVLADSFEPNGAWKWLPPVKKRALAEYISSQYSILAAIKNKPEAVPSIAE